MKATAHPPATSQASQAGICPGRAVGQADDLVASAGGPSGLLATKLYPPRAQPGFVPRPRLTEEQSVAGLLRSPGFDDPQEPERWDPRLKLVDEILLTREPLVAQFPPALRWFTRLSAHSTTWSRKGTTVLHYRFSPAR